MTTLFNEAVALLVRNISVNSDYTSFQNTYYYYSYYRDKSVEAFKEQVNTIHDVNLKTLQDIINALNDAVNNILVYSIRFENNNQIVWFRNSGILSVNL